MFEIHVLVKTDLKTNLTAVKEKEISMLTFLCNVYVYFKPHCLSEKVYDDLGRFEVIYIHIT